MTTKHLANHFWNHWKSRRKHLSSKENIERKRGPFCNQQGWLYIRDIIVADKDLPNFVKETTLCCRQKNQFITYNLDPPTRFHTDVHIKQIPRVPINWKQIQQKKDACPTSDWPTWYPMTKPWRKMLASLSLLPKVREVGDVKSVFGRAKHTANTKRAMKITSAVPKIGVTGKI